MKDNSSQNSLKIALGSDHAGFRYKEEIKVFLNELGHETKDFGTFSEDSCDYPEFVTPAAQAVASQVCDIGIVLGGSGNGEAMAANKVNGIRCALGQLKRPNSLSNIIMQTCFQLVKGKCPWN